MTKDERAEMLFIQDILTKGFVFKEMRHTRESATDAHQRINMLIENDGDRADRKKQLETQV